jgi:hypothetical protein
LIFLCGRTGQDEALDSTLIIYLQLHVGPKHSKILKSIGPYFQSSKELGQHICIPDPSNKKLPRRPKRQSCQTGELVDEGDEKKEEEK